jgi:hypothetical protein
MCLLNRYEFSASKRVNGTKDLQTSATGNCFLCILPGKSYSVPTRHIRSFQEIYNTIPVTYLMAIEETNATPHTRHSALHTSIVLSLRQKTKRHIPHAVVGNSYLHRFESTTKNQAPHSTRGSRHFITPSF